MSMWPVWQSKKQLFVQLRCLCARKKTHTIDIHQTHITWECAELPPSRRQEWYEPIPVLSSLIDTVYFCTSNCIQWCHLCTYAVPACLSHLCSSHAFKSLARVWSLLWTMQCFDWREVLLWMGNFWKTGLLSFLRFFRFTSCISWSAGYQISYTWACVEEHLGKRRWDSFFALFLISVKVFLRLFALTESKFYPKLPLG